MSYKLEPIDIAERIALAYTLSALSYIKPGAPHRYSPHPWLLDYATLGITLFSVSTEAASKGLMVGKGEISAREARVSKLILESLRVATQQYGKLPPLSYTIPTVPVIAASTSHAITVKGGFNLSTYRSSIRSFLIGCTGRDVADYVKWLYDVSSEEEVEVLREARVSEATAESGYITLLDVFEALAKTKRLYSELLHPETTWYVAKDILESYGKIRDPNLAVTRGYITLILELKLIPNNYMKGLREALNKGLISTKEGVRELYELDKTLRSSGVDLSDTLPLLTLSTFIALLEGFRL